MGLLAPDEPRHSSHLLQYELHNAIFFRLYFRRIFDLHAAERKACNTNIGSKELRGELV